MAAPPLLRRKRQLGKSRIGVSEIGFGAWAVGGIHYGPMDERQAESTVEAYLEAGGNFIDTARWYGRSEEVVGNVVKRLGCRDRIVIATKLRGEGSKEEVPELRKQLEASLRALKTEYVDLCFFHTPPTTDDGIARWADEHERFKGEGKLRAFGASIYKVNVTPQTVDLGRRYLRTGRMDVLMLVYSVFRQLNVSLFGEAADRGVGIVVRSVLESGFLTGTLRPGHRFADGDHRTRWSEAKLRRLLAEAERLKLEFVKPPYETLAQLAIRFSLSDERVASAVVGAETAENVRENTRSEVLPDLEPEVVYELKRRFSDFTEECNA